MKKFIYQSNRQRTRKKTKPRLDYISRRHIRIKMFCFLISETSQCKISAYNDVINQQKENKTNPNEIKYRQKSKTCTILKKSPQYKSAQTYSERFVKYD